MKNKLPTILLCLSFSTLFGFDVGQEVELTSFLNGRANPDFLKFTDNIKTQLPKGTTGEVMEVKKFNTGNSGIKMKVNGGAKNGETYWVYYNKEDPAIELTDKKTKTVVTPEEAKINETKAITLRTVAASRDLGEHAVIETAKEAVVLLDKKEISKATAAQNNKDCPPDANISKQSLSQTGEGAYKETDFVGPFRETPRKLEDYFPGCNSVDNNPWETCKYKGAVEEFKLTNGGPNKIVTANEYYINRSFEFQFDDRARSDMKMMVVDAPDDTTSHTTYSIMLFFPRSVLPSIKKEGNELTVTLPNKEIVKYDATTKEIIGGVFTEGKMAQGGNKKALPPAVKYTGAGVMIRADKSGDLPYGDIEDSKGNRAPSITTATVSKKGFPDCKIPSKDIWYTDYDKKNVLIKPEYATDAGLDSFIKKKCGFSLF
ncbi:MAG: hypothetical protein H7281_12445 [Bacteriovorax sp.]|nr:hypothetical protein [Bacteriovorax sp.]